ncbi:MAG: PilZ domain-containing protein [Treponema sp.]|nr:PilZ domain-containing protein [Candidatus Treponema equi]
MGTGSPLAARGVSFLYIFIIVTLIVLAVAAIVGIMVYRYIAKTHTKEWLEAQKNRETKLKDVDYVGREANLNQAEKIRLWHMCRRYKAKNIRFLYRSVQELDSMFREEYERITTKQTRNEEKIGTFFSLRYKLENAHNRKLTASSTRGIKAQQKITIYDVKNNPVNVEVVKVIDGGFYVDLPEIMTTANTKQKPLDRIKLTFTFPSGQAFNAISRVMRYEKFPDSKKDFMFIADSTHIKPVARRGTKRMAVDQEISFSAIKNAGTDKAPVFEVQQKKYPGVMKDLSASGCKILCNLPINKGQFLDIHFKIPGFEGNYEAQGKIVSTKSMTDKKTFALHIQYINIAQNVKNDIYSAVYGYS